jgi:hypothetical protein
MLSRGKRTGRQGQRGELSHRDRVAGMRLLAKPARCCRDELGVSTVMWRCRTNGLRMCEPLLTSNLIAYGLAAVIFFSPSEICAQAAEDTVAFILFGLENGARSQGMEMDPWKAERIGDFVAERSDSLVMRLSVRKLRDCAYHIFISAPKETRQSRLEDKMIVVNADFAKMYSIQYQPPSGRRIAGLPQAICEYVTGHNDLTNVSTKSCTDTNSPLFPKVAQAKQIAAVPNPDIRVAQVRVDAAIGYFKNAFCFMRRF